MNNYFIDSTIWIEFFKGKKETIRELVIPLIDDDRIYYNGIVLSELLIGATNEYEFNFIKDNFRGLRYLNMDLIIFEKASKFGFEMRRKGINIPLSDLLIASHCKESDLTLLTMDKHFKILSRQYSISLQFI